MINRGNGGARVFHSASDYLEFCAIMSTAREHVELPLLAWCLMPNHIHLVCMPRHAGDLGRWMQRVFTTHVRRHHRRHGTFGAVWQGRYKAFPVQDDSHLLTVMRYVERNPVRANLAAHAADWRWSSLAYRSAAATTAAADGMPALELPPVDLPRDWTGFVDRPLTSAELEAVRVSVNRERPYGSASWVAATAARLGLESSLRRRGRPVERP